MNHQMPTLPRPLGLLEITIAVPLALSLSACDGLANLLAKPEPKKEETVVAVPAQPPEKKDVQQVPDDSVKLKPSPLYEWNGNGRMVSRILVDTDTQKAHFYVGDDEVGWSYVATGITKYPTPTGQFKVIEKVENKRSNLYGKVYGKSGQIISSSIKVGRDPIPAGARFEGSQMPYYMRLTQDGVGLHAGPIPRPGKPASHGCIRMPRRLASVLFAHVSNGTDVKIVGSGPSYGNYIEKQRAIAATQAADQRRQAAKKAAKESKSAPAAATARQTPKVEPAVANNEPQVVPGNVIEAHAVAKDTTGIAATVPAANVEPRLVSGPLPADATAAASKPKPESAADAVAAKQGMPLPSQLPTAPAATPPAAAQAPVSPTPPVAQQPAPAAPVAPKAPKPEPVVAASTPPATAAPAAPPAPPAAPPAAKPAQPPAPAAAPQPSTPDDKAG